MSAKFSPIVVGSRYGKLVCLAVRVFKDANRNFKHKMLCDCGFISLAHDHNLKSGVSRSCRRCRAIKLPGYTALARIYNDYRYGARKRGHCFELTLEQLAEICKQNCFYCGAPPVAYNPYLKVDFTRTKRAVQTRQQTIDRAWVHANGLDRKDNAKGYTIDNCVACCAHCNYVKSDYTYDEFIAHCKRIVEFQIKKGDSNGEVNSSKDQGTT